MYVEDKFSQAKARHLKIYPWDADDAGSLSPQKLSWRAISNVSLVEDRSASSNELSRLRWRVVGDRARPVRFASPSLSRLSVKTPFSLSYDTDDIHLYTLTRPKEIE